MKILNLTNLEKSDIKYEVSRFPDGQQQVKITEEQSSSPYYSLINLLPWMIKEGVQIKSRLNNFRDLELIICATKSLRNLGVKEIHLYTPYFLGSRSDRKFEKGSNNYLKDVICPIINSLNFESVTVLDPHSDVLEACLNNFRKESNLNLVIYSLQNLYFDTPNILCSQKVNKDVILVSPDAGANKKIYNIAEQIGYKGNVITCSKSRSENGQLSRVEIPLKDSHLEGTKDFIIIDDICDGGATFINIVKKLRGGNRNLEFDENSKIYLIVTHGIFSKGFDELSKYFDGIYCTNSYQDIERDSHFSEDLIFDKKYDKKIKQLNVF